MLNNIYCQMKGKKVIHWGGLGGMGEPSLFRLRSAISVFTWISKYKAITTLLCLILVFDVLLPSIH